MKRWSVMVFCVMMVVFVLTGCGGSGDGGQEGEPGQGTPQTQSYTPPVSDPGDELHHVELDVKDYGVIKLELNATTAPISVANFLKLAEEGFYDGLTFHRIMDGFMIQGGDPLGNGTGGSSENIKGEFADNGVENNLSHVRGVVSMARRNGDNDSATSQFFIVQADSPHLDGQYAAFGYVTEGMDVVDKICKTVSSDPQSGLVEPKDQPVITSVKVID